MEGDLVTIVVPAYNAERFLHENVESIRNQTYRNLEIIYVCDGCTDRTAEILQEYALRDSRMIVRVERENHGAAISRNFGLHMANGEWIIFWDADDLYERCAIEEMIGTAVKEQADLVCCYWEYFDDAPGTGVSYIDNEKKKLYCDTYPVVETEKEIYHILQLVDNTPCMKLIHRSIYTKEEVFFQNIPNANDVYFAKVVAMNSHKMIYIDKAFYHYRSDRGRHTLSTDRDLKKNYLLEAYDEIYKYIRLKKNNRLLLRSFYNDVIINLNVYLGCPVYSMLFDALKDDYFYRWGMQGKQIIGELSYINRVFYKNILENKQGIDDQGQYVMQARVEFLKALSKTGCSIWGTGKMGSALLNELSKKGIQVQHVFDSAQDMWGKRIHGYVVENFAEVQADHIIITTPKFYDEIVKSIGDRADSIYNLEREIWLIPNENIR